MKPTAIPTLLLILFGAISASSQNPEVNFTSLEISQPGRDAPIRFILQGINSSGQPIQFIDLDSSAIDVVAPYRQCGPCSAPKTYDTNVFANPIIVEIGEELTIARFFLTLKESPPIWLNQRIWSRKASFYINGRTRLHGRIEVKDESVSPARMIAFDNDVMFEGAYSALFGKPIIGSTGKRETWFQGIVYLWNDARP